ncbi:unnamed protein product [Amaranthus hypochondriacus]
MEGYHNLKIMLVVLLFVFLLGNPIDGRREPGEYENDMMMKEKVIPEAIKDFILYDKLYDAHKLAQAIKDISEDFDSTPNATIYHDDADQE